MLLGICGFVFCFCFCCYSAIKNRESLCEDEKKKKKKRERPSIEDDSEPGELSSHHGHA